MFADFTVRSRSMSPQKADLRSLDLFVIDHLFMELFSTNNIQILSDIVSNFSLNCELTSVTVRLLIEPLNFVTI